MTAMVVIETTCFVSLVNAQLLKTVRYSHMALNSITVVANVIKIDLNPMQSRHKSYLFLNEVHCFRPPI